MLQMYGEKAEQVEELRLDIQDLKTLYRQQVREREGEERERGREGLRERLNNLQAVILFYLVCHRLKISSHKDSSKML